MKSSSVGCSKQPSRLLKQQREPVPPEAVDEVRSAGLLAECTSNHRACGQRVWIFPVRLATKVAHVRGGLRNQASTTWESK